MRDYDGPVTTNAEVIQAFCGGDNELLMQSVENKTILARLNQAVSSPPSKENNSTDPLPFSHPPNIVILFIDALSRAHVYRRLPKTVQALVEIQESGNGDIYQFFKYHALGSHTGPNTIPMFTGAVPQEDDANSTAIPNWWKYVNASGNPFYLNNSNPSGFAGNRESFNSTKWRPNNSSRDSFNFTKNPIWWQPYDPSKYVRSWIPGFCENWPETYLHENFKEGAIDHLMVMPFCHPDAFPLDNPYGPFNGPYSIRRRCIGDRKVHTYSLQYAKEFLANYKNAGKILTVGFLEGHEGSMEIITQVDDDLGEFLRSGMGDEANNTFVFLVADHGNHMSPYFLWATGGKMENKLPMLFVKTPPWFKERYPTLSSNLLENQNRLFTAKDLYATLTEFSHLPEFGGSNLNTTALQGLLNVLPDRSCKTAGISEVMCVFEKYSM